MHALSFLNIILFQLLFSVAQAAVPVIMKADIVINDFDVFWKDGQLLTVSKDKKKVFLPLEENLETSLPADIKDWNTIDLSCSEKQSYQLPLPDKTLMISVKQTDAVIHVQVLHKGMVLAQNLIQRPSALCNIQLLTIKESNRMELAVSWNLGDIKGLSVFQLPEALR